ncbi:hypothetical protein BSLG_001535 [Batrachochytrium salamandrivorans]|nr:hypothetical protein BSLG_001535 [Batrachochytrium salamandrivorans]
MPAYSLHSAASISSPPSSTTALAAVAEKKRLSMLFGKMSNLESRVGLLAQVASVYDGKSVTDQPQYVPDRLGSVFSLNLHSRHHS